MSNFIRKRKPRKKEVASYTIFSDGSANGKSGAGYVCLVYEGDKFLCYGAGGEVEDLTNNQAELKAIELGVNIALGLKDCRVDFYSDSKWAIGAVSKNWKIKKNLDLVNEIRYALEHMKDRDVVVRFHHVPREEKHIQLCDKYANIYRKKGAVKTFYKFDES